MNKLYLIILVILLFLINRHYTSNLTCNILSREQQIEKGKNFFKNKKVAICGLIRDGEERIYDIIPQVNRLAKIFKDYKVFVVENDSKDDTRNILLDWADSSDDKVFVLGCNGVNLPECKLNMKPTIEHDTSDYRINKMATLRNIYLEELKNHDDIDLVIVWDFDIVGKLDMNGFYLSGYRLTQDENINVICANGIRKEGPFYVYYDTYAYREHGDDYRAKSYYDFKYSGPTTCEGNLPLKYVRSCFGGLTIYRKDALLSSTYGTRKNKADNTICEHEYLHERIDGVYHSNELLYLIDKS
jgi:hypothetical protein